MRITVLGGSGYLGSRTVEALRKAPNVDVQIAGRRGPLVVDATKPETFSALEGSDVVIDLIDATTVAPDAVAAFCVEKGIVFIEATSDRPAVERLAALEAKGPGLIVLGGGIFTGVSNLLGHAVAQAAPGAKGLTLAISSSPYSGAGGGTIALMVAALSQKVVRYARSERVEVAELEEGPKVAFPLGERRTLHMSFAEPPMLHRSTRVPDVQVFFAPRPSLLVAAFLMLPAWLMRSRLFAGFMSVYFTFLRRFVLKAVTSPVELWAKATGATDVVRAVTCADGMLAGGAALAAIALKLAEQRPTRRGVCFVDEVCALEPVVARANALMGHAVMTLHDGAGQAAPELQGVASAG
jgi:hypothetical protein